MSSAIGCDIDGVVTNFTQGFTILAHSIDSDAPVIRDNQCPTWDYKDWYMGGAQDDYVARLLEHTWELVHATPWFWSDLQPMFPDDMDDLRGVYREWPVVFITRRAGFEPWAQTVQWFRIHQMPEPLVYVTRPGEEKSEVCKKLGITVMIEDGPMNIFDLQTHGVRPVVVDWPYNQLDNGYRAKTLGDALQLARSLVSGNTYSHAGHSA